jgi:hypothetical protein
MREESRMSRSLPSGAHSRDPVAHPGYKPSIFGKIGYGRRGYSAACNIGSGARLSQVPMKLASHARSITS